MRTVPAASACCPSGAVLPERTRPWSAIAISPAQMGDAALVPASPSHPTAEADTDDALSVLVNTSYSWAAPESIETSGSARAPVRSILAGTAPACQLGSGSTALNPPPPPPDDPLLVPLPQATSPDGPVPG